MPDFGAPVAQNVQPPNGLQSLKGLMGLQEQQQKLQIGGADAQLAQQTMQERQRFTQMMQNGVDDQGNSIRDASGTPDISKILPALGRVAPLTGQQIAQNILKTQSDKTALQSASISMDAKQRQAVMGPLQAIATNPNDPGMISAASDSLDQWQAAHPEMKPIVDSARSLLTHIQNAPSPDQRAKMANSLAATFQPGQAVQTQPASATVDNGASTLVGTTSPPVTGAVFTPATSVPKQIPPTQQVVDPTTGTPRLYGQPNQPGPQTGLGPTAVTAMQQAADIRKSANDGAATYMQSQFNNNQIVRLAQDPNALGHGGDVLAKLTGGYAAVPWSTDMASNWNNIGHYMGLQAITQMKAAGLAGTDADKALAQSVTGDRTYTKDSIVGIARVNRALSEGARLFNEGVESANATGNPAAVVNFRNRWSSTANVDGFMLYNAKRSQTNDPGAFQDVVKEMGGPNSPRYKAALSSIDSMRALILGGNNGAR